MHLKSNEVLDRSKKVFRKEQWRTIYEDCYRYLYLKEIFTMVIMRDTGQNKMNMVFDSTAIHSLKDLQIEYNDLLFPPYKKWCRLELR